MTDGPSRAEFQAFCDRIYSQMDRGFTQINERLDALNSRTLKGEVESENHRGRLTSLESRWQDPKLFQIAGAATEAPAFSKREYAFLSLGFAVVMALVKLIELLGTKVWDLATK